MVQSREAGWSQTEALRVVTALDRLISAGCWHPHIIEVLGQLLSDQLPDGGHHLLLGLARHRGKGLKGGDCVKGKGADTSGVRVWMQQDGERGQHADSPTQCALTSIEGWVTPGQKGLTTSCPKLLIMAKLPGVRCLRSGRSGEELHEKMAQAWRSTGCWCADAARELLPELLPAHQLATR